MPEEHKEDKGYKVVDKRVSSQPQEAPPPDSPGAQAVPGAPSGTPGGEKESASGQDRRDTGKGGEEGGPRVQETGPPEEITFSHLVLSLLASALQYLDKGKDLPHAKQTIDALGMLQEKTKGNLSKEEEDLLKNVLFDLRLRYVEGSKK